MGRQTLRLISKSEANEDLMALLTNVRSRQNTLVFFLELFALSQTTKLNSQQYAVYKQEFLQKQKLSTEQIRHIIEQLGNSSLPSNHLRSFWIKLKSILRVSQERAKTLGLLNDGLANLYAEILQLIDKSYEASRPVTEYFFIQKLIKKRTLETLIFTKNLYCTASIADAEKIRSQTFLKNKMQAFEGGVYSPSVQAELPSLQDTNSKSKECSTRVRKREKGKSKATAETNKQTAVKSKNLRSLWQLERKLLDLMDVKIETLLDKRKTLAQNQTALYDALFSKNIHNHKIIAKYVHYCTRMPQLLRNKKTQSKRNLSQTRLNRRITASKANQVLESREESRHRLERPKTTKQSHLQPRLK